MAAGTFDWTNASALALAGGDDPVAAATRAAQEVVLRAREEGWGGPPFNPIRLVEMLGARTRPNANVADARLLADGEGPVVEYNPQQPRERMRFSIAHEAAHMLFPDWRNEIRNRGGTAAPDDWQLEMLCNIAAAEFVLPIGSLPRAFGTATIEDVMRERRRYDVSAEAFLIRYANVADAPVSVFVASPVPAGEERVYRVDYAVASPLAPRPSVQGRRLPAGSAARNCTAIGHTDRAVEDWFTGADALIEYVGVPGYPGSRYPRVAGIVRHERSEAGRRPIRYVHGDVTRPLGDGPRIVCQLVNDRAVRWGGGVARRFAGRHPGAERAFSEEMRSLPGRGRLGRTLFSELEDGVVLASLVAQEGFGPSPLPRIRYHFLRECVGAVAARARRDRAEVHMPRVGTGAAGGDWGVIEEIVEAELVREGVPVTVYDPPPRREQFELFGG